MSDLPIGPAPPGPARAPVGMTVAGLVLEAIAWAFVALYVVNPDPQPEAGSEGGFGPLTGAVLFAVVGGVLLGVAALRCALGRRSDAAGAPPSLDAWLFFALAGLVGVGAVFAIAAVASWVL